jgi:hypothetical protein
MKVSMHGRFIEEVINSQKVFTSFEGVFKPSPSLEHRWKVGHFLMVAGLIDVVNHSEGLIEFGVHSISDFLAAVGTIAHDASPSEHCVIFINDVVMLIQELVLINRHAPFRIWFKTLARICAPVANHDALELYLSFRTR